MSHLVKQKAAAPPPPVIPAAMAKQMKKTGSVVPQARLFPTTPCPFCLEFALA